MATKINRSAKSGKFVSKKFAKKHPSTTVKETVKSKNNSSSDKAYLRQAEAWTKTQQHAIASDGAEISFLKKDIANKQKMLRLLQNEQSLKWETLKVVKKQMQEVMNRKTK